MAIKNERMFKALLLKNIQIKTIVRYNFAPIILANIKGSHNNNLRYKCEEIGIHVLMKLYIGTTLGKTLLIHSYGEEAHILLPAINYIPGYMVHRNSCTYV